MITKIIACKTIENELLSAMDITGCHDEILWLESGLHNVPKILHHAIQSALDQCADAKRVMLAMGYCGNSVVGLKTGAYDLIMPRADDCISILLYSDPSQASIARRRNATYFMTEGWLKGERNIWREYEYAIAKYGEVRGKWIFDTLFRNYDALALLDTGCFPLEAARQETAGIAQKLGLRYEEVAGETGYLEQLLLGPWPDDRFLRVPPDSVLTDSLLYSVR